MVFEITIGPVYFNTVTPSVVYRIVAPGVVSLIFTDWALAYVPPAGENVGVAAAEVIV